MEARIAPGAPRNLQKSFKTMETLWVSRGGHNGGQNRSWRSPELSKQPEAVEQSFLKESDFKVFAPAFKKEPKRQKWKPKSFLDVWSPTFPS